MTKPIVTLSDYNKKWEQQFEFEKDRILRALGDKVIAVEHIGSTSIKGLVAKPIIDIIVGVEDLDKVSTFVEPLRVIEYEFVPKPEFKERRFFRKGPWGQGTCHLHICNYNSREWTEKLMFRDYLRLHPEVCEKYAALKKELALKYQFDRPTYTKKKEPFIQAIIEKAQKEARQGDRNSVS